MPLLNNFARIPVCGLIAHYNQTELPPGPDRMSQLQGLILQRSLKMQGFIVSNYRDRIPAFVTDMSGWLAQGKVKYREDLVEGLGNAPEAFLGLVNPLSADEYAGRQFLYPVVPETDVAVMVLMGGCLLWGMRRR